MSLIISIGGTGSKFLEAFLFYSAIGGFCTGSGNERSKLKVLNIDPDKANANFQRADKVAGYMNTLSKNTGNFKYMFPENIDYLIPEKTYHSLPIFDSNDGTHCSTMNEYFGPQKLPKLLFAEKARNENMDIGFKGRASVGSAVMASLFDIDRKPWNEIQNHLGKGGESGKVFLCGSVFGGTGASIFPTLARLIKTSMGLNPEKVEVGGALIFPYFDFRRAKGGAHQHFVDPDNFLSKSKLHMEYYYSLQGSNPMSRVYMIGEQYTKEIPLGVGGQTQNNPAHHVELLGAMALYDFLNRPKQTDLKTDYMYLTREHTKQVSWKDIELIGANGGFKPVNTVKGKFLTALICSTTFLLYWNPLLRNDDFRRTKLYITYFSGIDTDFLNALKDFYCDFILWVLSMQTGDIEQVDESYFGTILNAGEDTNVKFVNYAKVKELLKLAREENLDSLLEKEPAKFISYILHHSEKIREENSMNHIYNDAIYYLSTNKKLAERDGAPKQEGIPDELKLHTYVDSPNCRLMDMIYFSSAMAANRMLSS
ncbi:hypothetical protein [Limisalsivibrio acetivorans]|uniref:hypothetical protein n=1 Tax=Limisalsivibrio acetivorans TaxID=1304888 RepID=UPI0003B72207|nr:hypothetical protein [Limisalsivibrio acetivorans]